MKQSRILLGALLMGSVFAASSCLKKDFETPPDQSQYDPKVPVNTTLAQLKSRFGGPGASRIDSNWTVYGIVTADDRSGNFYKQINIEDSTGGITLLLDNNSLYNEYPIGRKVYVNLKGLYFGYYGGLPQIGSQPDASGSLSSLTPVAISQHITKANYPNTVVPISITMDQAANVMPEYFNRLVKIENVEFNVADTGKTFAQAPTLSSGTSIDVVNCDGKKVIMRTSGYANFQSLPLPNGNGSITALYTVFNGKAQLIIRDTSDVKFHGVRCGSGGGPTGNTLLSENFGSATTGDINLLGWTNVAEAGSKKWGFSNAGSTSNPYARVSAFGSSQASVISWLVTPELDLSTSNATAPYFTFKSANGFDNGATMKVYVSTNFTGNVATATWTQLNPTLPPSSVQGYSSFVGSGNLSLAAYIGQKVHIAFKYEGADLTGTTSDKTTTWEIDDLKVLAN